MTAAQLASGSPSASSVHDPPPSRVRCTRSRPPGGTRSMSATSGTTHAVPGVRGEARTGKPKSAGSPPAMERQETPASSVAKTPKWFCA